MRKSLCLLTTLLKSRVLRFVFLDQVRGIVQQVLSIPVVPLCAVTLPTNQVFFYKRTSPVAAQSSVNKLFNLERLPFTSISFDEDGVRMIRRRPLVRIGSIRCWFELCNRNHGVDTPVSGYLQLVCQLAHSLLHKEGAAVLLGQLTRGVAK